MSNFTFKDWDTAKNVTRDPETIPENDEPYLRLVVGINTHKATCRAMGEGALKIQIKKIAAQEVYVLYCCFQKNGMADMIPQMVSTEYIMDSRPGFAAAAILDEALFHPRAREILGEK